MYLQYVSVLRAEIREEGSCIDDENNGCAYPLPLPQIASAVTQIKNCGYMKRYIADGKREYHTKKM
jgi:hypothetical protein